MKKYFLIPLIIICFFIAIYFSVKSDRSHQSGANYSDGASIGGTEGIQSRRMWEFMRVRDPITGKIPRGIFRAELEYAKTLPSDADFSGKSINWVARGPYNVGGRTRGAAVDIANENIIVAGGVSGGVWRTTDGGATWTQVVDANQLHNVTTLVQDTRLGHTNTWYFGTGEYYGNSASAYGGDFIGNGVYKSTDNGITWFSLPSTASNTPNTMDSLWDYVWRIAIDPSNLTQDVVYAATYKAIYKSTNGGTSWSKTVLGSLGASSAFSDVAITSQGVVYATINRGGPRKYLSRSADGVNWANITSSTFPTSFRRIVIGINPSDENEVYFFANTPGAGQISQTFTNETEGNSLWKYTYISGDGTGAGGSWIDLSSNLPNNGSTNFDNIYVQNSYNMVISVKPDNPSVVFIGGTNIYRSTDGFTSMNNTTQIGGYKIGSYFPYWDVYKNHHPDQHGFIFLPSNPDVMITYTDGGLYKTGNCMADTVQWARLNNGYRNSQVYTVTFNKFQTNDILLAGFQDNGNYFTNTADPAATWNMSLNGDGSFGAISNDGSIYYLSIQLGKIYKMTLDGSGNSTGFARIDPIGNSANDYMFINPFVLDPNNNDIMYVPAYNKIWRHNTLSQLPLAGNFDSISTGWFKFTNTVAYYINAIAVSKNPANILYAGILGGRIYRFDNADQGDPVFTDISNYQFNNLYYSCITVDPLDANKIIAVFSNYNAYSLLYSSDGGATWGKVAGNLEEFENGTGNGPSCRWASILHVQDGTIYFVGTSVGLFATDTLIPDATVWTNIAANTIGSVVVDMVETRDIDGLVVVGTHGNGVYSTKITSVNDVLGKIDERDYFAVEPILYPNPANDRINLKLDIARPANLTISFYDINGKLVSNMFSQKYFNAGENIQPFNISKFRSGRYFCKIESDGKANVLSFVVVK
ncbi:MAG: T9SS type A sorting domain-containing protein [Bacteroidia bacterium]|nr:T9SS type A sorting domain-containing protein [Bacteroidia bacterium]